MKEKALYYSPHPHLNSASPSGYGTHMREMIRAFEAYDLNIERYISGGESLNNLSIDIRPSIIKQVVKKILPGYFWRSLKDRDLLNHDAHNLKALLDKFKNPDFTFIYERYYYSLNSGITFAKKYGIPHIYEVNAPYLEEKLKMDGGTSFYHNQAKSIQNSCFTDSDLIVVVSSKLKEYFVDLYDLEPSKILVIPNAINKEDYNTLDLNKSDTKKSLGFKPEHKIIGFVGSIFPYHGVDTLIDSFSEIQSIYPESKLLIVGDGESLNELKDKTTQYNLDDFVVFTGNIHHSKVKEFISIMDICVMAKSNWYGSPVKVFEYGALGKPIIAPNNGPLNDVISNGTHAKLINESQVDLTNAITWMLNNPLLANQMAQNFKIKVNNEHTWAINAKHILSAMDRIK